MARARLAQPSEQGWRPLNQRLMRRRLSQAVHVIFILMTYSLSALNLSTERLSRSYNSFLTHLIYLSDIIIKRRCLIQPLTILGPALARTILLSLLDSNQ